ncbi:PAS domain-containing sensor histidine kinase [Halosimplex pelagicum]|uniref:histidine kinase n=2 Tax=Halosimplex pelagicum TaxID=869886 RepID=A0A7D5PGX0_9EURY|nr:PAS domain-containing sensor histidine kinase [Halosimplex pelagicum]
MLENPSLVAAALDSLDDVFYVYDTDAKLVAWNRRLNDVFDTTDAELRGTHAEEFFIEADRERVREAVAEVFDEGETTVEARVKTAGPVVRFQLSGHRLVDDDGRVAGFSGIGRDVTENHEQAVRLSLQNERLESFANVVSHDLRNPLQVAIGLVDVERRDRDSDRLDRVADALDRMDRIVSDVLTVAREGSDLEDPTSVALAVVARDAWETVDTGAATLDVRTQTAVEGDPDRLDRLFANCFRNAVEHGSTNPRSQAPEDAVEHGSTSSRPEADDAVEHGGDGLTVSVVDTERGFAIEDDGVGIPVDDRERVFDAGVSRSSDGTGFGLDIVRTVAEAHGWTVTVGESETGGAAFEFDLGLVEPSADDD